MSEVSKQKRKFIKTFQKHIEDIDNTIKSARFMPKDVLQQWADHKKEMEDVVENVSKMSDSEFIKYVMS